MWEEPRTGAPWDDRATETGGVGDAPRVPADDPDSWFSSKYRPSRRPLANFYGEDVENCTGP